MGSRVEFGVEVTYERKEERRKMWCCGRGWINVTYRNLQIQGKEIRERRGKVITG